MATRARLGNSDAGELANTAHWHQVSARRRAGMDSAAEIDFSVAVDRATPADAAALARATKLPGRSRASLIDAATVDVRCHVAGDAAAVASLRNRVLSGAYDRDASAAVGRSCVADRARFLAAYFWPRGDLARWS